MAAVPSVFQKILGATAAPDTVHTDTDLLLRGLKNAGIDLELLAEEEKRKEIAAAKRRDAYKKAEEWRAKWRQKVISETEAHLQEGILRAFIESTPVKSLKQCKCPSCGSVVRTAQCYLTDYHENEMRHQPWHRAPGYARGQIPILHQPVICPDCKNSFALRAARVLTIE